MYLTVAFFTLFGFIFLITQYFQFVKGYGPLSTGVHLLPVALSVGIGSVAGTQLAVRAGTKLIVTVGLVAMAAFYGWVAATTTATLGYGVIAVQMVLYGLGMGLTSSPATESIMGAVSRRQAGVGSAVNDSTRLLGGTLGVAVTGRIPGVAGRAVHDAATNVFIHGLSVGALVAGGSPRPGPSWRWCSCPPSPRARPSPRRRQRLRRVRPKSRSASEEDGTS